MSIARSRTRTLAASALAALTLAGGLSACTESPEETAATSSTTTTLPDNIPSVAWLWANPEERTGEDVRVPVYASIQGGTEADVLTGVKVDPELAAQRRDRARRHSVELPATTTVNLSEDSVHIELVGLEEPLEYNRAFEVTLEFEKADDMKVHGVVRNPIDPSGDRLISRSQQTPGGRRGPGGCRPAGRARGRQRRRPRAPGQSSVQCGSMRSTRSRWPTVYWVNPSGQRATRVATGAAVIPIVVARSAAERGDQLVVVHVGLAFVAGAPGRDPQHDVATVVPVGPLRRAPRRGGEEQALRCAGPGSPRRPARSGTSSAR